MMQPSQRWEWWLGGLLVILTAVVVPLLVLLGGSPSASGQTSGQTTVGATIHPAGNFPVAGAGDVWLSSGWTARAITDITGSASMEAVVTAIDGWAADLRLLPSGGADGQVLTISNGAPNWAGQAGIITDQTLTGTGLPNSPLGLAGLPFTAGDSTKLAGIETGATADQTGAEMVTAIDAALGGAQWQTPGAGGGSTTTSGGGLNQAAVDARVEAYTGQTGPLTDVSWDVIPGNLPIIDRAYQSGGYRQYPATDVRLCGEARAAAYTSVPSPAPQCGSFTQPRAGATLIEPAYVLMRFDKTAYAESPSSTDITALRLRIVSSEQQDEPLYRITVQTALSNTAAYWYVSAQVPTLAADDDRFELMAYEPATLNILPADNTIGVQQLEGLGVAEEGQVVTIGADGALSSKPAGGLELLKSGSFGAYVPDASNTSAIQFVTLDQALDLDTQPRGLVFAELTGSLVGRSSNSIGWDDVGTARADIHGQVSLQEVANQPAYLAVSQLGQEIIRRVVKQGTTELGYLVIRLDRNASNEVRINLRYEPKDGRSTQSFTISLAGRIYLLSAGVQSDRLGSVGAGYVFQSILPDATSYGEDSVAYVLTGDDRGVHIKDTQITHGVADTGWAGKVLDPSYNLSRPDDIASGNVTYTHRHVNASSYTDPRGSGATIATGGNTRGLPVTLAYVDFSYTTPVHGDGVIEIKYLSTRSYTGAIQLTTRGGGITTVLLIPRVNGTTWRLSNLTAGTISHLLGGQWTMTEPGHGDTIIEHQWVLVANVTVN